MKRFLYGFLALCVALAVSGATKKSVRKAPKSRTAVHAKASGKGKALRAPVQHSQAAPTSDRYREIQQALATKGYLKSDPSGLWDADAQDAMRRFQSDQKLDQTGKIDALSLISLGLGPTH